jgi:putative transposase
MPKTQERLLDEIVGQLEDPSSIFQDGGILDQLKKKLVEKCLQAEMDHHLGYKKNESRKFNQSNSRNGFSEKTIRGKTGSCRIKVPRDREAEFEPRLISKRQTVIPGLDEQVIALYARGMSTRDIQASLREIYGTEISHDLISNITDQVIQEAKEWQNRRLEPIYAFLYLDCLVVSVREQGKVIKKSVYLALGVSLEGQKELLGIWFSQNEGAKFWLSVLTELKNRGVEDIFVACVDGLTGFPDAINSVFPLADIQLCMVHLQRNSWKLVSWKERKEIARDLKNIYQASTASDGEYHLELFAEKWDKKYPSISKSWRNHWENIIPMFQYPPEVRKAIYTTNAIESVNMSLRKVTKNRRIFPNETSVLKTFYLAIQNISKKWTMPIPNWKPILNWFSIYFENRFPKSFTQFI